MYRHLVVQGYNTNIDHTLDFFVMPEDIATKRLMVEVHFYDPYDFSLNESSGLSQWEKNATDPSKTAGWGNEDWVDSQFGAIEDKFIKGEGVGVILGEYGAISRNITGHAAYRRYYMEYVTASIVEHRMVLFTGTMA